MMAARRYTVVSFEDIEGIPPYVIHKPGCKRIQDEAGNRIGKSLAKLDLEWEDEHLLEEIIGDVDVASEFTMRDVELCACTGYEMADALGHSVGGGPGGYAEPVEEEDDGPSSVAAAASREAALKRLQQAVEETVEKLVAKRGVDDIGEGDRWAKERLASCTDDYIYDLAVEVRKLRERNEAWWRVAYELELPGSGASNKQGRKGSAFARRLWRAAWGKTYLGERGQRDSKVNREARAMANLGRPYFSEEATELDIINAVTGKMIHWVARLEGDHGLVTSAQEAYVHHEPRLVKLKLGPKGRYIEFYEQVDPAQLMVDPRLSISKSGPVRSVYVDRITRVGV